MLEIDLFKDQDSTLLSCMYTSSFFYFGALSFYM
jgi:hypothetical protein